MPSSFAARLLAWYAHHGRKLPWRETHDPYRIWVSEIMLQQTQVETVLPYYRRWLERFPDVAALAAAPEREVLARWEGLGYYSRARNLHRAAQRLAAEHSGRLPRSLPELRALPGIGPYTAAAIASLAFGADAAVLDGNVKRVLARVFDYKEDVKSARGEKELWAMAQRLLPPGRAGDYNQALMDLGATVCTPRAPACGVCPLRGLCAARRLGLQLERPVTKQRPAVPRRTYVSGVVRKNGRVLIVRRPAGQLLGGLWAFPAWPHGAGESPARSLRRGIQDAMGLRIRVGRKTHTLTHGFTHFQLTQDVFECEWQSGRLPRGPDRKWVRPSELPAYPMGRLDRRIAEQLIGPDSRGL